MAYLPDPNILCVFEAAQFRGHRAAIVTLESSQNPLSTAARVLPSAAAQTTAVASCQVLFVGGRTHISSVEAEALSVGWAMPSTSTVQYGAAGPVQTLPVEVHSQLDLLYCASLQLVDAGPHLTFDNVQGVVVQMQDGAVEAWHVAAAPADAAV